MGLDFIAEELARREAEGFLRRLRCVDSVEGPHITVDGRRMVNFASNSYLGLHDDPDIKEAARRALEAEPTGALASRLVSGNMAGYDALEGEVARWVGAERAIVFPTGYMANLGALAIAAGRDAVVVADRLVHASVIDAARLAGARLRVHRHNDVAHLAQVLARESGREVVIAVTESIFSMDGDRAPLTDWCDVVECAGAVAIVDDAHATGVVGETGAGCVADADLSSKVHMTVGTFSKALAGLGGFIATSDAIAKFLVNCARSLIFTTGLPPAVLAGDLAAVRAAQRATGARGRLDELSARLRRGLDGAGFDIGASASAIVPAILGEPERAVRVSGALAERGFFAPAIRPPAVPRGTARLRLSVTAAHRERHIDDLVKAMRDAAGRAR